MNEAKPPMSAEPKSVAALLHRISVLEDALVPFIRAGAAFAHRDPSKRVLSTACGDISVLDFLVARATREPPQ